MVDEKSEKSMQRLKLNVWNSTCRNNNGMSRSKFYGGSEDSISTNGAFLRDPPKKKNSTYSILIERVRLTK